MYVIRMYIFVYVCIILCVLCYGCPAYTSRKKVLNKRTKTTKCSADKKYFVKAKRNTRDSLHIPFHIPFTIKNNISKKCRSLGFT